MRTNLIFSAMAFAALAFAGCSQDDTFSASPAANQLIGFDTYVGRDAVSRADVITEDNIGEKGFGVFAYYTGQKSFDDYMTGASNKNPNFMNNEHVYWITNVSPYRWDYTPGKYWPNNDGDKVSFFAYAPYIEGTTLGNDQTIKFTVASDIENQVDLLWNRISALDKTKPSDNNKVKFTFAHALARIGLAAKCSKNVWYNTKVYIDKIMLTGSEPTYNKDAQKWVYDNAFHKSAKLSLNPTSETTTAQWTEKSTNNKLSFTWEWTTNPPVLDVNNSATAQSLTDGSQYAMVIPQNFRTDADGDGNVDNTDQLYVFVQYRVVTPLTVNESDNMDSTNGKTEVTNCISNAININFEPGKAYTLNLVLDMDWIELEPESVDGWDPVTSNEDVPIPAPTTTGA